MNAKPGFFSPEFDQTHVAMKGNAHYAKLMWYYSECDLTQLPLGADSELFIEQERAKGCVEYVRLPDSIGLTAWCELYEELKPDLLFISDRVYPTPVLTGVTFSLQPDAQAGERMRKVMDRLRQFGGGERRMHRVDTAQFIDESGVLDFSQGKLSVELRGIGTIGVDEFRPDIQSMSDGLRNAAHQQGYALSDDPSGYLLELQDRLFQEA